VVVRIDVVTLRVEVLDVGDAPVAAAAGALGRVVVAGREGSVSLIDGLDVRARLDCLAGMNAVTIAESGTAAVVWFQNDAARAGDPIGSLSSACLVDAAAERAWVVAAPVAPRQVDVAPDGRRVALRGLHGVSILSLDGETPRELASFDTRETGAVEVSDDARFVAMPGAAGSGSVEIRDLVNGVELNAPISGQLRDLAWLSSAALAVVTGSPDELLVFDAGGDALVERGRTALPGASFDRVEAFGGDAVAVFSGSQPGALLVYGADAVDDAGRWWSRRVISAFSPLGAGAGIALHRGEASVDGVRGTPGYTVFTSTNASERTILSAAIPTQVALSPGGLGFAVLMPGQAQAGSRLDVSRVTGGPVETLEFGGRVDAIGWIDETTEVYAASSGASGSILLVNPATGATRNLSSYILNAFVE
jgi:hypothetical protein